MTRINVVPVTELTDKHLLAEYRELPRVFGAAKKWHERHLPFGGDTRDLPQEYVLGKGHVKFFYDKLLFLSWRFIRLVNECERRGFNVKFTQNPRVDWEPVIPPYLWNDYTPTPEALRINRERINTRLREASQRRTASA